jgi:hypothetical protein
MALLVASCLAAAPAPASGEEPARPAGATALAELGIQVTALRSTAGGFMLDLRYRVVDPERAKTLLDRKVPAYLVDEATGAKLAVPSSPKLGKLRQGTPKSARTDREYGMLFGNPGRFLKPGATVTLVAGEARVAGLTVR